MNSRVHYLASTCSIFLACSNADSNPEKAPGARLVDLEQGVAAKVAHEVVSLETLQRIVAAEQISAEQARARALFDTLCAVEARVHFAGTPELAAAERAELARAMLEELLRQAKAQGEPSDPEINDLTGERWQELDRPLTLRTTHAVVLNDKPEREANARALAERLRTALSGVTEPQAFIDKAKAFPTEGFELRAERLPALTEDGRPYDPNNPRPQAPAPEFDRDFSHAVHTLSSPGELSKVVKTRFGFHVILLEERILPHHVPLEERRTLLRDEIFSRRAEAQRKALLAELKAKTPVELSTSLLSLTDEINVKP